MNRKWQLAAILAALAIALVMVFAAELLQDNTQTAPTDASTRHDPVPGVPPSATGDISNP